MLWFVWCVVVMGWGWIVYDGVFDGLGGEVVYVWLSVG